MKKFMFSLGALYDVKKAEKDARQAQFAAATAALEAAKARKEALEKTHKEKKAQYEQQAKAGMTVSDFKGYAVYFEELLETIQKAGREVDRAAREVEARRGELVAVHKEIKVLEKLYDKQYAEYVKEFEKSETKTVDDIVSYNVTESGGRGPGAAIP
ncbi:flagellar export protein FliJ [Oscillospiraceae bacterium CM]|nr:flagellar export protein FliJ [Oscillospiraceae bacterium CM]